MDKEILASCETILKELLNLVQTLKKKELNKDEIVYLKGAETISGTKILSPKCLYNEMGWNTEVKMKWDKSVKKEYIIYKK